MQRQVDRAPFLVVADGHRVRVASRDDALDLGRDQAGDPGEPLHERHVRVAHADLLAQMLLGAGRNHAAEDDDVDVLGVVIVKRAYYSALAPDFSGQLLDLPGGDEVAGALAEFRPAGSVLDLACGPGTWTAPLLRHASDVTGVDASRQMLAIAASRVPAGAPVRFVEADLFSWVPDRRYDVVFMAGWLSHVPADLFESFWARVAAALATEGRVFFADDHYRTREELIEGAASSTIERRTPDGTAYRIVKVPHDPAGLERRLRGLGWDIAVRSTAGPYYGGAGCRAEAVH
jgi:SAM-dependent methyltransferase